MANINEIALIKAEDLPINSTPETGMIISAEGNALKRFPTTFITDQISSLQDTTARYAFDTLQEAQDKWASFSQEEKDALDGRTFIVVDENAEYKWDSTETGGTKYITNLTPTGVVEEGNTEAVSGGEVYNNLEPVKKTVNDIIIRKNKFNPYNILEDTNVNVGGGNASLYAQAGSKTAFVELKENTDYYLQMPNFNTTGYRVGLFDSLDIEAGPTDNRITNPSFNSGSWSYLCFGIEHQGDGGIDLDLIQLEEGASPTDIVPYNDISLINQAQVDELQTQVDELQAQVDDEKYIHYILGKNLFDFDDLLFGWRYAASTGYVEHADGIMSNKLYLSVGQITIQGVKTYSANTVRILAFNGRDELLFADPITIDSNRVGNYTITTASKFINTAYFRICLQFDTNFPFDKEISQLEYGGVATAYEAPIVKKAENPNHGKSIKTIFASGASTTVPSNGWFERACRELGFKYINAAVSGESVMHHATKAWKGTLWTSEELDNFDVLSLSHNHNYDISFVPENPTVLKNTVAEYENQGYDENNNPLTPGTADPENPNHRIVTYGSVGASGPLVPNPEVNERYAAGYDYLIKKYRQECYNLKDNPDSKWYGSEYGKPCTIIICSHWHDGYVVFNEAAKTVCDRTGAIYSDTASYNGWTWRTTDPDDPNSIRWSAEVCNNASYGGSNDLHNEPINGVIYTNMGFHPTRDVNSEFNKRRASVFKETLRTLLS